jgi:hypothetical protein
VSFYELIDLKVNERREMCGSKCIVNACNDHLLGLHKAFNLPQQIMGKTATNEYQSMIFIQSDISIKIILS